MIPAILGNWIGTSYETWESCNQHSSSSLRREEVASRPSSDGLRGGDKDDGCPKQAGHMGGRLWVTRKGRRL